MVELSSCVLAVDVGTTTVSFAAVERCTSRVVRRKDILNPQMCFGSDVISRIERAPDVARAGLLELIDRVRTDWQIDRRSSITAVGNTVMAHFLLGRDPTGLGVHPYRSQLATGKILSAVRQIGTARLRIRMLPLLGRFVGSDCCAAILAAGMHRSRQLSLLVDAGTNGEVALGNRERILVCSTAAGPAFEGATLECGSIACPGAVSSVRVRSGRMLVETIQGKPATGICGSGVLAAVAAGLRLGLIESSGRLRSGERLLLGKTGLYISQRDLREIQLAKAAIAAGIRILLKCIGARPADIERIFLTGRFGGAADLHAALIIGLLPNTTARKRQHRNLALRGAVIVAANSRRLTVARTLADRCREILLSGRPDFEQEFISAMEFAPWG
ncbi:MAG: ASKHA domain-containing protein [candidate division WOR-3 bacterium]